MLPLPLRLLPLALAALLASGCHTSNNGKPDAGGTSATIGADGGTVTGPDQVTLDVPAGSLPDGTTLTIARDSTGSPPLAGMTLLSPIYAVTPHGAQFGLNAALSVPYDTSKLPAGAKAVVLRGETDGTWHVQPFDEAQPGVALANVSSLSWYAVAACTPGDAGVFGFGIGDCPANHSLTLSLLDGNGALLPVSTDFAGRALPFLPDIVSPQTLVLQYDWTRPAGVDRQDILLMHGPKAGGGQERLLNEPAYNGSLRRVIQAKLDPTTIPNAAADPRGTVVRYTASASYCWTGFIIGRGPNQTVCWSFDTDLAFRVHDTSAPPSAPLILAQPADTAVVGGEPASFTVKATSADLLGVLFERFDPKGGVWRPANATYWYPSGGTYSYSANDTTFTFTSSYPRDDGARLRAVVCNALHSGNETCLYSNEAVASVWATRVQATSFTAQPKDQSAQVGSVAHFTAAATGQPAPRVQIHWLSPAGVEWFDDCPPSRSSPGSTSCDSASAPLTLAASGTKVWAVAWNDAAKQFVATTPKATLTVYDAPKVAADAGGGAAHLYSGFVGVPVTFDGSASAVVAGPAGAFIASWSWDLNGDGVYGDATGVRVSRIFTAPGTYQIGLKVTDSSGLVSDTASATVSIADRAPVANAGGPYAGPAGATLVLDGSGSSDPDPGDTLTYAWDLTGSGSFTDAATVKTNFTISGAAGAVANVCLRVTDAAGKSDTACTTVTTQQGGPAILVGPAPQAVAAGGTAVFTVSATGTAPLGYAWQLGSTALQQLGNVPTSFTVGNCSGALVLSNGGATLVLTGVSLGCNGGQISVVVSNGAGSTNAADATATLSVTAPTPGACLGATSNWCYVRPSPQAGALFGLAYDAANARAFAVGGPVSMRTGDLGTTWTVGFTNPNYFLQDLALAGPNRLVAAGLQYGQASPLHALFTSDDLGATWTPRMTQVLESVQSVAFVDASVGVAVGTSIWRTTDGGSTWAKVTTAALTTGDSLLRAAHPAGSTLVAVGGGSGGATLVVRSTDGGQTWSRLTVPAVNLLADVAFSGSGTGLATTTGTTLLSTSDDGATWTSTAPPLSSPSATGVAFADKSTVSLFGFYGETLRSTDGGATWSDPAYDLGVGQDSWRVLFSSSSAGLAVGAYGGTIARTIDGGASWQQIGGGKLDDVLGIDVSSAGAALACSADAGATWARISQLDALSSVSAISWGSSDVALAAGLFGDIAKTTDGGLTFSLVAQDAMVNFQAVGMASASQVVVAGRASGSATGKGGFLRVSSDGGSTWKAATVPSTNWIYAIRFLTPLVGLAGGQNATLLRTTDGGATWSQVPFSPAQPGVQVRSISRIDDTTALLITDNEVKRSTDGGQTWARVYYTNLVGSLAGGGTDGTTCLAVGPGTILRSTDACKTFSSETLPIGTLRLNAVGFVGSGTVVVGGDGGALLRNTAGGAP
jgi:photosystem II stability/assembly factor-like uncharacterized protein